MISLLLGNDFERDRVVLVSHAGLHRAAWGYKPKRERFTHVGKPRRRKRRADEVLPPSLPPVAGTLKEVAKLVGMDSTKYRKLVRDGLMPGPSALGLYDFEEARRALKRSSGTLLIPRTDDHSWDDLQ
jgi:hypothetical protein